jgi:hypothetical protein
MIFSPSKARRNKRKRKRRKITTSLREVADPFPA